MNKLILLLYVSFAVGSAYAQDSDVVYYSELISLNIQKYKHNINAAYQRKNFERADFLFDSLVNSCLIGSQFDEFKIHNLNNKTANKKSLITYEKPLVLLTSATWCVQDIGEVPAINELADKYHDQIDFKVLFWDKREDVRKVAKNYNNNVSLCYIDETDNTSSNITNKLKHVFGVAMGYYINKYGELRDVRKDISHHYSVSDTLSYELHYNSIAKGISKLIAELEGTYLEEEKTDDSGESNYDENGFNPYGFDRDGFDENGFDEHGFDKDGFDRRGFDENGFDVRGYDENGIDINGIDEYGVNPDGGGKIR